MLGQSKPHFLKLKVKVSISTIKVILVNKVDSGLLWYL